MKETTAPKSANKMSQMKDYDEILEKLIAESKRERDDLDHQITLKKNQLLQTQEQIVRQQQEFEKNKRISEEKRNEEFVKRENAIALKEHALRVGEDNFTKRMFELGEREKTVSGLVDERKALANERIEVEKLHRRADDTLKEAHLKLAEADSKYHKASMLETVIREKENQINGKIRDIDVRENTITDKLKDIKSREKNFEEVKKVIDPKLEELKFLEKSIKDKETELSKKGDELRERIAENSAIIKGLEEREKKVKERERMVLQKDEEITRKALLAGINK
jgi:hypothetical protein